MASSIYSEVTASPFKRDRVLNKLTIARNDLPYNVDDITISHNDFAIADVYNDSLRKVYSNYLFLIANAEIHSNFIPVSAAPNYMSMDNSGIMNLSSISASPGDTTSIALSSLEETFVINQTDNNGKFLFFNYSKDNSVIFETFEGQGTLTTLLTGNEVEFNKTFKFKNVVSVDTKDNFLFVLDKGANTVYKFDITGLVTNDPGLKRTDLNDTKRPGRYLLKTIGGDGNSQTKNKLSNPSSLSVYKNRIYILDNGHNSIKVFDIDFNFIQELTVPNLFNNPNYGELVSIVVDQYSNSDDNIFRGYILSSKGKIFEYNPNTNVY